MAEKQNDIGALWVKSSAKGQYMTGMIELNGEKINIVCFTNQNKKEAKHPDWRILKSVPKDSVQENNVLPQRGDEAEEINPEDIPF
jgi:hypothetical protein